MFGGSARLSLHMYRPLKRQVIVGMHAREAGDRRVNRLKIHEVNRIFEGFEFGFQVRAKPGLPRLHRGTDSPLHLAQLEISRYVGNGLDAHFLKLFGCTGMEPWQVADMILCQRLIAVIKKLADHRFSTVRARGNIGRLCLLEGAELCAKPNHNFWLQVSYSLREISKDEKLPWLNCCSSKHVFSVDVSQPG